MIAKFILIIGALGVSTFLGAQESGNSVGIFSAGWRTVGPDPENVLQLGVVFKCQSGWCIEYDEYHGKPNIQRTRLPFRHEMQLTTQARGCVDENLTAVNGERSKESPIKLMKSSANYIAEGATYDYEWVLDDVDKNSFRLKSIKMDGSLGPAQEQPIGYMYWSEYSGEFVYDRGSFNAYFDGSIAHKDTLTGPLADWSTSRTSLDFRKFIQSVRQPNLLSLTQPGSPEVLKRFRKPVDVQHSFLMPGVSKDKLTFFYHEYGHDFNADGCFDEFGHNKILMPVVKNNAITAFVFVEYTPDNLDGIPMLSVGRYFRRAP